MQNLLLKIPYKFKKSYGGTPEPQTTQDAPRLHGPSLKKYLDLDERNGCFGRHLHTSKWRNHIRRPHSIELLV